VSEVKSFHVPFFCFSLSNKISKLDFSGKLSLIHDVPGEEGLLTGGAQLVFGW
jgi:hypothetical protein